MRSVLVLALFALILAGCGGSKKSAATTTAAMTTTTTTTTTEAAMTTAGATGGGSLAGIASAANCKQLSDLGTKFSSAVSGTKDTTDFKKVALLLKEFAAKTPNDIRPDFQLLAEDYGKLADALGSFKAGTAPDPAALAKLEKVSSEIDSAKLSQASQHISAWLQKNCTP